MKARRCPCCGKPDGPVRFCQACKKPISTWHKWRRTRRGLVHRCCAWPGSYLGPDAYRAEHGEAMFRRMAPALYPGLHIGALKVKRTNEKGLTRPGRRA